MGDVIDDIGGYIEDAADVAVKVAGDAAGTAMGYVGQVAGPIAEAVGEIPIVGDAVQFVAPLAGPLGAMIGGPVGAMIGNTVGNAFNDGGPNIMGVLDGALDAVGGALPSPIDGVADKLLDGDTLIDGGMAILGGGALPDLGDIAAKAGDAFGIDADILTTVGGIANGEMPSFDDIGGFADKLGDAFGVDAGSIIKTVGGIADGNVPDLDDAMGAAKSVFDNFGLGDIGSAVTGTIMGAPAAVATAAGGAADGGGGGGFGSLWNAQDEMYTSCWNIAGDTIGTGGGDWNDILIEQANDLPGTIFDWAQPNNPYTLPGNTGIVPPVVVDPGQMMTDGPGDFAASDLDDLVFNMPGVDSDRAAREELQRLVETGQLGETLASMAPDDVTTLMSRLISPSSPAADVVQSDNDQITDIDDGMTLGGGDATAGGDAGYNDPLGIGIDDLTGEPVGADAATSGLAGEPATDPAADPATGGPSDGGVNVDDFSIDGGGDAASSPPAEPQFTAPEPEPAQDDFSQAMDQANAAETQLDSDVNDMFEGLG